MLDVKLNNKYRFPKSVYSILSFHGRIVEELLKAFKVDKWTINSLVERYNVLQLCRCC
jgi:hypothetical protein